MNGEDCMFSHESLTEDTQELLDKVVIADILNVVVESSCCFCAP